MQVLQLNTQNKACNFIHLIGNTCVLGIKYADYGLQKRTKWYDPLLNGNQLYSKSYLKKQLEIIVCIKIITTFFNVILYLKRL